MKKMITVSVVALAFLATACAKHDREYYESNQGEALAKAEECQKELENAMLNFDKAKVTELQDDQECNIATDVIRQKRKAERKARYEKEAKEKELADAKIKAKEKIAFDEEYKKQLSIFEKMDYPQFVSLKDKYSLGFSFMQGTSLKDAQSKAYSDSIKSKETKAIEELIATVSKEKMLGYKDEKCLAGWNSWECDISNKAYNFIKEQQIKYYDAHRDELKRDFNQCVDEISTIQKQHNNNFALVNTVQKTYKCDTTSAAAKQLLTHFGFSTPIK